MTAIDLERIKAKQTIDQLEYISGGLEGLYHLLCSANISDEIIVNSVCDMIPFYSPKRIALIIFAGLMIRAKKNRDVLN